MSVAQWVSRAGSGTAATISPLLHVLNAIVQGKLPRVRKLKAMHERVERLLEPQLPINDKFRQVIDYIRAMKADDPDFAACQTFKDYLKHAATRISAESAD